MYIVGNAITITWVLKPTATPLLATDYDIRFVPSNLDVTYTDAAVINYVAPTIDYPGSIQYLWTPAQAGHYQIYLTTGVATAYSNLDKKNFWVFFESPNTQPSTEVHSYSSIIPKNLALVAGISPSEVELYSIATDGTKFIVTGRQAAGGWGVFHTDDMKFNGWTWYTRNFTTDTPRNPHIAYGNGRWVMCSYYGREAYWSTDGINWTAATLPSGDPLRTANYLTYIKNKDVFYMGRGHGWYSDDGGEVWKKRDDLQSFPEVFFTNKLESPLGFSNTTILGMGQESMIYTSNVTQSMGAFTLFNDPTLWAGSPAFNYLSTDGIKIVAMSNAWDAADSTNLTDWDNIILTGDPRTTALLFMQYFPGEGKWYAVTQDLTNPFFVSDDAINWQNSNTTPFEGYPKFFLGRFDSWTFDVPNNGWAIVTFGTTPTVIYQV